MAIPTIFPYQVIHHYGEEAPLQLTFLLQENSARLISGLEAMSPKVPI